MTVEAWLDTTPGETRGVVARDGRFERLIIHRDDDRPAARLGARLVGRIEEIDTGLNAAFVDIDGQAPLGFLALKGAHRPTRGSAVEVEVTAETRDGKSPTLRLIAPAEGQPRLLAEGPSVEDWLARWAPGVTPVQDAAAIQAGWEAEEEALAPGETFAEQGVDLMVERTRALIAVDVDHAGATSGDRRGGQARANRFALSQTARILRLKAWGGLVAVDLAGAGHDGDALTRLARAVFTEAGAAPAIGPVSRFGLLQIALAWGRTPVEEILNGPHGRRPTVRTRAQDVARRMRHALLSDTTTPRLTLACAPQEAELATPLVRALGPRAHLIADPAVAAGEADWRE